MQILTERMRSATVDPVGSNVQIRNVDPAVVERLRAQAAKEGATLSEYLRRELDQIVQGLDARERWEQHVIPGLAFTDEELRAGIREGRRWEG